MTDRPDRPKLTKPVSVTGARLRFRDATPADAGFILGLRLDADKGRFLSPTSEDVDAQVRWLCGYAADDSQIYFIIEDLRGAAVGTVRLYDARDRSFCWGSWILSDAAPRSSAVESTMMIYAFALGLGFDASHFDVRRGNQRVWAYHERWGAVRVGESELDYFYTIDRPAIEAALARYADRLPGGIVVA